MEDRRGRVAKWIQAPSPWTLQPCPRPFHYPNSCPTWAWGVCLAALYQLMCSPVCRQVCMCAHARECSYCSNSHKIHAASLGITTLPFSKTPNRSHLKLTFSELLSQRQSVALSRQSRLVMVRAAEGQTPSWVLFHGPWKAEEGCSEHCLNLNESAPGCGSYHLKSRPPSQPIISLSSTWCLFLVALTIFQFHGEHNHFSPGCMPRGLFLSISVQLHLFSPLVLLLLQLCKGLFTTFACIFRNWKERLLGTVASLHLKIHFKMPEH